MKKIIINFVFFIIISFLSLIIILSTIGLETDKFNKLISTKASLTNNIDLKLNTIKFRANLKELSLFLETQNPKINYRNISIPVNNIKAYIDFLPLFKSELKIKKISLVLEELNISQLNELSIVMKPSNFKSILNNKIKQGKLISEIDIFLTDKGDLKNFIAKGSVKGLQGNLLSGFNFSNINLSFFADKNDILIKNIFGNLEDIKISDGDIKLNLEDGIKINSNFNSQFNFDDKLLDKYSNLFNKYKYLLNLKSLEANLNNNIFIDLDKTYKLIDYNYSITGKLEKGQIKLPFIPKNDFISEEIKEIYLSNLQIKTSVKPDMINFKGEGKYSLNNTDFLKINLENSINKNKTNLLLDFDYKNSLEIILINYKKTKDTIANLSLNIEQEKDILKIITLKFKENKNSIIVDGLEFKKNILNTFKKIRVDTINNNFYIQKDKKILIKGNKFDATNLSQFFSKKRGENKLKNLSNDIEIDFKNIKAPMSEKLYNFKLIGKVHRGQFIKVSSKGDFGGDNFLDISMKKDTNTEKKYLEIFSDLPRPLLSDFSFFNGLSGGKLLFSSIIDGSKSNSKLKIENFKIVNAPAVIKLLSLADLGGLADLAEGDGLSFDVLEIDMEKNKNFLKLNEILALGPSMSVLMEGYQEENGLTSIRGTIVPAKTLNKIISKIPVIGSIVIPKEVGEGMFGISFKMKGPKGKIKTTINPIRTLTPRFIQKIIDKKNSR